VKPRQSEKLTLAMELGKLRLALRRPTDEIADEEEIDKNLPTIFQLSGGQVAMDPKPIAKPEVKVEPVAPPVQVVVAPPPPPALPKWQMKIMSPQEVRSFQWKDEKTLPEEGDSVQIIPEQPPAPAPVAPARQPSTPEIPPSN
jgi:hypothetical protein